MGVHQGLGEKPMCLSLGTGGGPRAPHLVTRTQATPIPRDCPITRACRLLPRLLRRGHG